MTSTDGIKKMNGGIRHFLVNVDRLQRYYRRRWNSQTTMQVFGFYDTHASLIMNPGYIALTGNSQSEGIFGKQTLSSVGYAPTLSGSVLAKVNSVCISASLPSHINVSS